MNTNIPPAWPQPGSVVSVPVFLFYRHKGIVSDRWYNGRPMIISTSARSGGVREEPWEVFAQGSVVSGEDYPGSLPAWEVLHRARSSIGSTYALFTRNCEQFVLYAHGLEPRSPQVSITIGAALLIGLLAAAG